MADDRERKAVDKDLDVDEQQSDEIAGGGVPLAEAEASAAELKAAQPVRRLQL